LSSRSCRLLPTLRRSCCPPQGGALFAAEASPGDLAGIGVSLGPGSYTGLRIGVSTALGISNGCGAGVVGVPTLEALVAGTGIRGIVLAAVGARRNEVFAAAYQVDGEGMRELFRPAAYTAAAVVAWARGVDGLVAVGSGRRQLAGLDVRWLPGFFDAPRPSAVACLAAARSAGGFDTDLEPLYLRGFGAPALDEVVGGA